jgi:MFS family permease
MKLHPNGPQAERPRHRGWTLAIVSIGLFMVVLDNLVVNVALPSIHHDLGGSIQALEWTVSAYVLAYAVLLLTGSALGDRFGRKRMFIAGIALFTLSSAAGALAPSTALLIAARASQGVGAAIVTPLTLTLLADAPPPSGAGARWGYGRASAASRSRSGRSSAARSSRPGRGTGSSGSTFRSA